jgi:D-alanyl-D-alanine carboxypeptidase
MASRTRYRVGFVPRFWVFLMVVGFVLSACASTPAAATPATPAAPTAFDQQLQSMLVAKMKEMKVPGAVIFVQSARTGSWTITPGTSDIATNASMNPAMHFRIGSITKTLTGTVILQLADEGKLGLDDPVGRYLPEVPNGAHITIRELLNMRSGLYNYSEDPNFDQTLTAHPGRVWTPQELVAISFKHPPYFAPNKDIHYSNTNTILLGMIIERITGQSVESEIQHRIFNPLGMNNSLMPARTSSAIPVPYSQGYMLNTPVGQDVKNKRTPQELLNVTTWNPSWGWTAGAAISTLHDLQIWAKVLLMGKLLKPATHKEQVTWYSQIPGPRGYGLAIADFTGFIGHNGQLPGYQSFMGYMPMKDETIIVLTNLYAAPDGSEPADALANIIMKQLSS